MTVIAGRSTCVSSVCSTSYHMDMKGIYGSNWVWDRDAVDRRIVQQVRDGKGRIPDSEQEVGGYPNLPESRRPCDVSQWDLSTMTSR